MRLRDTRMHCLFKDTVKPVVLRESCWREATFQALSAVSCLLIEYPTLQNPGFTFRLSK